MPTIDIPEPLPPAITPDREVIEIFIDGDLAEFGHDSLVARTWHWVLHGGGPGPISHTDWGRSTATGHPRPPPSPPKAPPANHPPAHRPPGTNSTGPGTSAGSA